MPVNILSVMGGNPKIATGETTLKYSENKYTCALDIDFEPKAWVVYMPTAGYNGNTTTQGINGMIYDGSSLCVLYFWKTSGGVLHTTPKTEVPFSGKLDNNGYTLEIEHSEVKLMTNPARFVAVK